MNERLEALEEEIFSVDKDRPGLVMRVDRLEWFTKTLVALASLGVAFQALEVLRAFLARQMTP
jgi:hypothetical protein